MGHVGGAGGGAGGDILTMNMIIQTTDTQFRSMREAAKTHPDNCCKAFVEFMNNGTQNINDVDRNTNNITNDNIFIGQCGSNEMVALLMMGERLDGWLLQKRL